MKIYRNILNIGDYHAPANHPDAIPFLRAVAKAYGPFDLVVQNGDEADHAGLSYHDKNPDYDSAGQELAKAKRELAKLWALFPKMEIIESNHGSLLYRKALTHGIPKHALRTYNELLAAPKSVRWHQDLTIHTPLGRIYFHHGKTSQVGKLSKNMSMSAVQGHYHSLFYIYYWANPNGIYWDMNAGCLVDDTSMAMAYNKTTLPRPIVGCAVIRNGMPHLIPMVLNKNGRWGGSL